MERDQADQLIAVLERIATALERDQETMHMPLKELLDRVERSYWSSIAKEQGPGDPPEPIPPDDPPGWTNIGPVD